MKPALARTAALALGLCCALAAGELAARALRPRPYHPPEILREDGTREPLSAIVHFMRTSHELAQGGPGARIKPHMRVRFRYDRPQLAYFDADGCVEVRTNRFGFRDLEFELAPEPGERRILAVGDSFTFGSGVQLEGSWPQQLESLLRPAQAGGRVEVINGGFATGSHWPAGYADWIESDGLAFAPEAIVIGFCLNDMGDVPMLATLPPARASENGVRSELLARVRELLRSDSPAPSAPDMAVIVDAKPQPWQDTQAGLLRIRDLCAAREVRLLVAVFPMLSVLGDDYPYLRLHQMVGAFCAQNGIECVDLLERFRGRDDRSLWVHPTDQHPNDEGQRLIAEGIAAALN